MKCEDQTPPSPHLPTLQASEPRARVRCKLRKQYRNMAYWLRKDMRPVELAREAFVVAGLKPYDHVIRGADLKDQFKLHAATAGRFR